jgi:RNA polymerase sigma factor (sigma-70 family)
MAVQQMQPSVATTRAANNDNDDGERRATEVGDLVRSAAAGDEAAWEAIVARYQGLLWSVVRAYRLNDSDAADVLQTTWVRLIQHVGRIRNPEAVCAWLVTTARRECLRVVHRASQERSQRLSDDGGWTDVRDRPEAGPEARVLAAEVDRVLWNCVAKLPERCQTLLRILLTDPPPTYEEVSAILNMPVGSIGPTRARCLQCLRRAIKRTEILMESTSL